MKDFFTGLGFMFAGALIAFILFAVGLGKGVEIPLAMGKKALCFVID